MKWSLLALVAIFVAGQPVFADDTSPKIVRVALKKAWVPVGFDDNDQIEIMVAGVLPNSCYQIGPYEVAQTDRGIEITQYAYYVPGHCSGFTVPFNRTVGLGIRASSVYPIFDATSGRQLHELSVRTAANPSLEDHKYAPVTSATILHEPTGPVLYLTGNLPSPSLHIKEVKVSMSEDVMVVLPIMGEAPHHHAGPAGARPYYQIRKQLTHVPDGTFLLHIRTFDGKGINQLQNYNIQDDPHDADHSECVRQLMGQQP